MDTELANQDTKITIKNKNWYIKRNQEVPFEYLGTKDDTVVYRMFRNVVTPGYQIDPESLKKTSITIVQSEK